MSPSTCWGFRDRSEGNRRREKASPYFRGATLAQDPMAALDEGQRKEELDRRIVLSQTEPLYAPPPSEERGRRVQR